MCTNKMMSLHLAQWEKKAHLSLHGGFGGQGRLQSSVTLHYQEIIYVLCACVSSSAHEDHCW